jgi:hypothetical protein
MSFARNRDGVGRKKIFDERIQTVNAPPPADKEPYWFDVRYWRKRNLIISAIALVAIIVIVIAVPIVEVKANAYPNYSQLTYTLTDTCWFL